MIEIVLCSVIALLVLALVVDRALGARQLKIMVAQCDERLEVALAYAERATDRALSIPYPENMARHRRNTGTVSGAQKAIKLHGEKPAPLFDEMERRESRANEAIARAQAAKEDLLAAAAQARPEPIDIATNLDFENNGAPR